MASETTTTHDTHNDDALQEPRSIEAATADIDQRGDRYVGPTKAPANLASGLGAGSIHDDKTAQKLGFSGGTVAGSVHMQQFPPMAVKAFGQQWFERGGISTYFRNATTHAEASTPFGRVPADGAEIMEIWAEKTDGTQILEGTLYVGEAKHESTLQQRLANLPERGDVRILGHIEAGTTTDRYPTRLDWAKVERSVAAMTEPLTWYVPPSEGGTESPWGGTIINPGGAVGLLRVAEAGFDLRRHNSVGLFGAIEINHLQGPMQLGVDYTSRGEVLHVGETPKSEYIWYRTTLATSDATPVDVAEMYMMLRFMKGSSELWS